MNHSQSILKRNGRPDRWFGLGLVMVGGLLLFFYMNIFNVRTLTMHHAAILQADAAYRKAQWGDAEIQYKKALAHVADSNNTMYNLANVYYYQGRYSEALTLYVKLSKMKNGSHRLSIWNNLGNAYYKIGALDRSYEAFKQALLVDETNSVVRQNFLYLAQLQQNKKAKRDHSKKHEKVANQDGQKKNDARDNPDGAQDKNKNQLGTYHFSDKEMNDMLQQAKTKVRVPQGTKSNNNHSKSTQPDY